MWQTRKPWARIAASFALLVPSNVVLLAALAGGIVRREPALFGPHDEAAAQAILAAVSPASPVRLPPARACPRRPPSPLPGPGFSTRRSDRFLDDRHAMRPLARGLPAILAVA